MYFRLILRNNMPNKDPGMAEEEQDQAAMAEESEAVEGVPDSAAAEDAAPIEDAPAGEAPVEGSEETDVAVADQPAEAGEVPDESIESISKEELQQRRDAEVVFSWEASEYVNHHKGILWYCGLAAGVAVLVGISALLHLWLEIVMFAMMAVALVVYANKAPRTMSYELQPDSITIDGKEFKYSEFKSFGVLPDTEWHTIDLEPTKRWSPRVTMLFGQEDYEAIVGHLELHLPRVDRKPDTVERATRYLRF
jgi:hypothetical protein